MTAGACRNGACDNADGLKGICAPGDTPDYCIACDDGRGNYAKPCPWPNDSCTCKSVASGPFQKARDAVFEVMNKHRVKK